MVVRNRMVAVEVVNSGQILDISEGSGKEDLLVGCRV